MKRRQLLQASFALGCAPSVLSRAWAANLPAKAQVVVIGGGYGGATAAKYVRLFSDHKINVLLIEPNAQFISCPMSNLVIGGSKSLADLTTSYDALSSKHGVTVVRDKATAIDPQKKTVSLQSGGNISYDKLKVCKQPTPAGRYCKHGKRALKPWPCASNSRPCPMAVCML